MNSSDISYLLSHYWSNFLYGTLSTVILSIVGTFGGLLLGIFLAFAERVVIQKELKWYQKGWRYALKGLANFLFGPDSRHPDDGPGHDFQIWLPSPWR
jgi:ABC-type amino acid transport system permease subunit